MVAGPSEDRIITRHHPAASLQGGFMARAAPSLSDPSCMPASQRHRAVIKPSKDPEHWGEETEGKAPLQPLETTEVALASPGVPLPSSMHRLASHPRTHRPKPPPRLLV